MSADETAIKLKVFQMVLIGFGVVACYPVVYLLKWNARDMFASGFAGTSVFDFAGSILANLGALRIISLFCRILFGSC